MTASPPLGPGQRGRRGWVPPPHPLDPLARLLRSRFVSRADLARATGLGYQTLRTYTDGRWTADQPPSPHVLEALARAVPGRELHAAVHAALHQRTQLDLHQLTVGQRTVLEALRGFDDQVLLQAAPHIHDLLQAQAAQTPAAGPGAGGQSLWHSARPDASGA